MTVEKSISDAGMECRDLLAQPEFLARSKGARAPERTAKALISVAQGFAEDPGSVLQKLVDAAVEHCGADSAGISLEERNAETGELQFRWVAIAGSFAQYLHGTTPRFFSPCGTCLNRGTPQLYTVTKPYYDFLGVTAEPITDGILVPWEGDGIRGTIWAIAHHAAQAFDLEDYELLRSLADFALIVLRHQNREAKVLEAEKAKAAAAVANQLAHEINNPLQCLTNSLYLASQGGADERRHLDRAIEDLSSLSELVRRLLAVVMTSERDLR